MAYDSIRQRVVLFGGTDGNQTLGDTLEWAGHTWIPRTPAVSPPPLSHHAMAFDKQRGEIVLFGGDSGSGSQLRDTWLWDGGTWQERSPLGEPHGARKHTMAYDETQGVVVLSLGATARSPCSRSVALCAGAELQQGRGVRHTAHDGSAAAEPAIDAAGRDPGGDTDE